MTRQGIQNVNSWTDRSCDVVKIKNDDQFKK